MFRTVTDVGVTQGLHGGDYPPGCSWRALSPHAPAQGLGHPTHRRDAQFPVRRCPLSRCVPSCYSTVVVIINVRVGAGNVTGVPLSLVSCERPHINVQMHFHVSQTQVGCTHETGRIMRASTRHIVTYLLPLCSSTKPSPLMHRLTPGHAV
jgi:hypothetical protein